MFPFDCNRRSDVVRRWASRTLGEHIPLLKCSTFRLEYLPTDSAHKGCAGNIHIFPPLAVSRIASPTLHILVKLCAAPIADAFQVRRTYCNGTGEQNFSRGGRDAFPYLGQVKTSVACKAPHTDLLIYIFYQVMITVPHYWMMMMWGISSAMRRYVCYWWMDYVIKVYGIGQSKHTDNVGLVRILFLD